MQKAIYHLQNPSSLKVLPQHVGRRASNRRTQVATGQQSSPTVFPEKRSKVKSSRQNDVNIANEDLEKGKKHEHRIDIGDEQSDLLGYEVFSGKLALDKKSKRPNTEEQTEPGTSKHDSVDSKLTSKTLIWGSHMLCLEDVISVC